MPGKGCGKKGHRKHTPIVSQKQRGLMGAELSRRRRGKSSRMEGMTTAELKSHLHESKGKKLPARAKARRKQGRLAAMKRRLAAR